MQKKIYRKKYLKKIKAEINKLKKTPQMSPESTVIRNYLDCLLALPWSQEKEAKIDLVEAKKNFG